MNTLHLTLQNARCYIDTSQFYLATDRIKIVGLYINTSHII